MANLDDPAIRPIRRISGWLVLGIFGLASFLILLAVVFIPWDVPAPDDADLRFTPPTIAADKNAFTGFEAAGKLQIRVFPPVNGVERDWTDLADPIGKASEKWDPAFADEVLTANAAAFAELDKGLACEHYASPRITDFSMLLPWLQKDKSLAELLALKSKRAQLSGDPVAAARPALQGLRFGQLITDNANSLIEWLVGIACQNIALARMNEIVADVKTPEPVLRDLLVQLDRWSPQGIERGYKQAMQKEYRAVKTTFEMLQQGKKTEEIFGADIPSLLLSHIPYCFKLNMSKQMLAPFYRNLIENADRTCSKICSDYPGKPKEPTGALDNIRMYAGPNSNGKILFFLLTPALDKALNKKCLLQANIAGLRLQIALRLYEMKHGQLPDDLSALVPEYLKEIPFDPYDGQPFRYSKTEKKVWAVGSNLKDDGGKMRKDTEMVDAANSLNCDVGIRLGVREMKSAPPPPPNESKK